MRERDLYMRGALGLAILVWSLSLGAQEAPLQRRWALVVGMDQYDSPDIAPLRCAVADATALAQTLREAADFDEDHLIVLTSNAEGPHHIQRLQGGLCCVVSLSLCRCPCRRLPRRPFRRARAHLSPSPSPPLPGGEGRGEGLSPD